ncbi:MAG: nucleoside triphosphate pyrophosphohydrolase [Oscillospiraceae bacterium]|nr:nucleoside triphosphate pyrophosphohydrolase [Oscillospiraceae bacterium]
MGNDFIKKEKYSIEDLLEIMSLLRSENGCPWDREQTHESIRKNFIEETYEAVEAIDCKDSEMLREELGDVLLQVVFHTQMEKENGNFDFDDICDGICRKLIVRHPHIFGDEEIGSASEVAIRWEEIKKQTKGQKTGRDALLAVPKQLPALMRCDKIQHRAEKVLGSKPDSDFAFKKLDEEASELREAFAKGDPASLKEKMGDLLFAAVYTARALGLEPEECLDASSEKFIKRFAAAEEISAKEERKLSDYKKDELSVLWQKAEQKTNQ